MHLPGPPQTLAAQRLDDPTRPGPAYAWYHREMRYIDETWSPIAERLFALFSGDSDMAVDYDRGRQSTASYACGNQQRWPSNYSAALSSMIYMHVAEPLAMGAPASDEPRNVKLLRIGPTFLSLAPHHLYDKQRCAKDPHRASVDDAMFPPGPATFPPARTSPSWPKRTLVRHTLASLALNHMALSSVIPCLDGDPLPP
ncbi:hypothetical protein V8C42DRAFT_231577 [Trichoderma barbatum]